MSDAQSITPGWVLVEEAAGVFLVEDLSDLAEAGAPEVRHGPFPDAISALNWLAAQLDGIATGHCSSRH